MPQFWKSVGTLSGFNYWKGPSEDFAYGIAKDSKGDFYICGSTYSYGAGNYDAVIIKRNSTYNDVWNMTWGTSFLEDCKGITLDDRDNIYIVGYTYGLGAGNYDAFLVKFGIDTDGDGYTDDIETDAGTDPENPNSYPGKIPGFDIVIVIITLTTIIGLLALTIKLKKAREFNF